MLQVLGFRANDNSVYCNDCWKSRPWHEPTSEFPRVMVSTMLYDSVPVCDTCGKLILVSLSAQGISHFVQTVIPTIPGNVAALVREIVSNEYTVIDIDNYLTNYIDALDHYLVLCTSNLLPTMAQWRTILHNCRLMFHSFAIDLREYVRVEAAR